MTTQLQQDNAIKAVVDTIAKDKGYPLGVLDSEKGTLTYDISTPEFGFKEALNRVNFRIAVSEILKAQPDMTITSHLAQLVIKLPDWSKLNG